VLVFNLVFVLFQVFFNMGYFGYMFTWTKLFLAFLLGGVAAGAAFGAMVAMKR
jgi:hypothetical protein